ncbi:Spore germination protein [Gloeomargarita lithophora Alchichica-D10]|uniref:Spore germination protein n=1 Tax=Gloeomargarita lithophora Alchichica-D10 TaxID=1188229 RepID=A0A1J0AH91_9CYAN|nr:GerMN domain-containing protein [Gloeomargarita lithophora]APB35302.1 Spore germination protein [Gloeomargarita lithophora Alchichica-D10]
MIRSGLGWKSRRLWWLVLAASVVVGGVGGGTIWWVQHSRQTESQPFVVTAEQPRLYWLKIQQGQEMLVSDPLFTVPKDDPTAALRQAVNLILGSPPNEMTTAIPTGTRLLSLELKAGAVYVNLSQEFTTGGGSYSVIYRMAQVIYTASSLNPQAPIYLLIEGQPAPPIAGEGLVIDFPTTRRQFAQEAGLPLI